MKNFILVIIILSLPLAVFAQLPTCYHTYQEVIDSLWALETAYSDIMDVFLIGHSTEDSVPIYAVKLSDSVHHDLDRPRLLFTGQVHAEETIGEELLLDVITEIVTHSTATQFRRYMMFTELYFIPSANPEGLNVVTDNIDITYRKNKRQNPGLSGFHCLPGRGRDSSGVDHNRNFDLNWILGDTLYHTGHLEQFDYYRGPAPFSEGGTQAMKALAEEKRFAMGIVYHQSRTGNVDENVIYPWNWNRLGNKHPPDFDVINEIGVELADLIHSTTSGTYTPHPSTGMYGNSHDWFYAALNCYNYTIETSEIQPDSALLLEVIDYNKVGLYYLVERACGRIPGLDNVSQLTGVVTDANTGQPLVAEIKVYGMESDWLQPRITDQFYGRYRWYLPVGLFSLEVSAPGYQTLVVSDVSISRYYPTERNVQLQPLPAHAVQGMVTDISTGSTVEAVLYFEGNQIDTVNTSNGFYSVSLPRSSYTLRIDAGGYVSSYQTINLCSDTTFDWEIAPGTTVFIDDFESGLGNWSFFGCLPWGADPREYHSGAFSLADSPYPGLYTASVDSSYAETIVDLTQKQSAHLTFWHQYYFEPQYDVGLVEVSVDNGQSYQEIAAYDHPKALWKEERLDLTPFCGNSVRIRFNIITDSNLENPGWNLDDIVVTASDTVSPQEVKHSPLPLEFSIGEPYPNPFNAETVIRFTLDRPGFVQAEVFNLLGESVETIVSKDYPAGSGYIRWNAECYPSGLYLIRLQAGGRTQVKKALMIK